MLKRTLLAALVLLLAIPAAGFGTKRTHSELADASLVRAHVEGGIEHYLRDQLGLTRGLEEALAVQLALDPRIETDLVVSDRPDTEWLDTRLNRSLSWLDEDENGISTHYPEAPGSVFFVFDAGCRDALDFDTCFADLPRAPIRRLIQIGTYAEDNPNPRARHHFHDPERAHGPSDNHGLDDSHILPGRIDEVLAEIATASLRGGSWLRAIASFFGFSDHANFELRGRSAIDRALNTTRGGGLASDENPANLFALPDAERYLYRALTYPAKDERENYLALHFIALGHVLHLLQDMASVAHVRNDFVEDHVLVDHVLGGTSLEEAGDRRGNFVSILGAIGANAGGSVPQAFLASNGSGSAPLSFFDAAQPALDSIGFDVADFWDRGAFDDPDDSDPARAGLAERVHNRFFSAGTISNVGVFGGYEKPNLLDCGATPGAQLGSGPDAVRIDDLPGRTLAAGSVTGTQHRFLASPLVPHLARCRYHALYANGPFHWTYTVVDESVQRDYLELLFPLAIDYGAKFLQHYLAQRIEVVPVGPGELAFRNLTVLPFTADADAIEIAYTAEDASEPEGRRARAELTCSGSELTLSPKPASGSAPLSGLTCTIPESLPFPALDALDFWVIVRGQLGERGEVGTPSEYDTSIGPKDFVVAFDHVRPELLFHATTETPAFEDPDLRHPIDLFSIPLDLTRSVEPGDVAPTRRNLTADLRAEIDSATLDLTAPEGEPGGVRIALRSDRDATESEAFWTDVAAPLRAFVFDPTKEPTDPAALVALPSSEVFVPSARAHVAPLWAADGSAVFYYEDASFSQPERPTKDRLVRAILGDPVEHEVFRDRVAYAASNPDETPDDLPLGETRQVCRGLEGVAPFSANVVAGRATCVEEEVVTENGQKRWLESSGYHWEIRVGTVIDSTEEPGKLEVVYTHRIDIAAGSIVACGGSPGTCWQRGGEPSGEQNAYEDGVAWSHDGTRLAFLRDPTGLDLDFGQEIWVADLSDGTAHMRMTAEHGNPDVPEWTPDGRWLVFGMALGEAVAPNPDGTLHVSSEAIDVHAIRVEGSASQAPRVLTADLRPFSIGLYAPLVLPSAP